MYNYSGSYKMIDGDMKLTWEKNFKSDRADGRRVGTLSALLELMRDRPCDLTLPGRLTEKTFSDWQARVKEKARDILCLPELPDQPDPVLLSTEQREGYRAERWEFYPDSLRAVPFLALIPDKASKKNKVPGLMCMLGSHWSKEFAAGEPEIQPGNPNVKESVFGFPERNRMARYLAENGMAAFVFDNPGVAELSVPTNPAAGFSAMYTRQTLCNNLLLGGISYVGLTVFQHLQFLRILRKGFFDYVDLDRIGISAHSLGTEPAIFVGLMCDDIKAIVFNEDLHDDIRRSCCITEIPERRMFQNYGNWHILPGQFATFGYADMCAAFAPRYLLLGEGGADEFINKVKRAYAFKKAKDKLWLNYGVFYKDPKTRTAKGDLPRYGLDSTTFYRKWMHVEVSDHSYRGDPAILMLKKAFGLK